MKSLFFSPDSSHVITHLNRRVARQSRTREEWRIWEARTGTLARQFSTDQDQFPQLRDSPVEAAFDRDASRLALAGPTNLWIFDLRSQPPTVITLQDPGVGGRIEFSPDGARLVTGSYGSKIARIWDSKSGTPLGAGMETRGAVIQALFSPDGTRVVTRTDNGYARVWDATSGAPLTEHFQIVEEANIRAVEPRGRRLLTVLKAGKGFSAQVWDVEFGLPVTPGQALAYDRFLDQGQWVISRKPGLISLRELPVFPTGIPAWLPDLGESLAGQRLNTQGFLEPVPATERLRLAQTLAPLTAGDSPTRWAQWLLAAPSQRSTSPLALRTWDQYVEELAEEAHWELAGDQEAIADEHKDGSLVRELRQVLRAFPMHPLAMARLGRELGRATNAPAQVEADWFTLTAWTQAPTSTSVARWRADHLLSNGRNDEALTILDRALLAAPEDSRLLALCGLALAQLGRLQDAEVAYSAAIRTTTSAGDLSGAHRRELLASRAHVRQTLNQGRAAQQDLLDSWQIPPRPTDLDPSLLDLSPFYNEGLLDGWLIDPGPAARPPGLPADDPGHDLSFLPQGKAVLSGVTFDVRGAVVLQGPGDKQHAANPIRPANMRGVPVGRNFERLHFLNGLSLAAEPKSPLIGSYRVHYADGESDTIPLRMGRDIWDSWQFQEDSLDALLNPRPEGAPGPRPALLGLNPAGHLLMLYRTTWKNPHPEKLVTRLDLNCFTPGGTLFVIAVTTEDRAGTVRFLLDQHSPEATAQALALDAAQAEAHIGQQLREDPANPAHWVARGLLEKARSRWTEAEDALNQALKVSGSEFTGLSRTQSSTLLQRSEVRARLGKIDQAKADRLQALGIPGRDGRATPAQIDLSLHYGTAVTNSWMKGVGMSERNDLSDLAPLGTKTLAGTVFDVRGVVQLANRVMAEEHWEPERVDGVEVGAKCRHLHFLHAAGWGNGFPGTVVGYYEVHYADGQTERFDLKVGEHLWDYWHHPNTPLEATHAEVAWMGVNEASKRFKARTRLFKVTWTNPRPDIEVQSLSFVSTLTEAAPFVISITRD